MVKARLLGAVGIVVVLGAVASGLLAHTALLPAMCVEAATQVPMSQPTPATDAVITSGAFAGMVLVTLHDGSNELDLEGDHVPDLIFRAWRDNGNAHGFHLTTFYRHAHYDADRFSPASDRWELVPFFAATPPTEVDSYRDVLGADCVLEDLFLMRPTPDTSKPTMAVIAKREFGETFVSSMPVAFDVYELRKEPVTIGRPAVFFEYVRSVTSTKTYCDVADAMNREFGVGPKFQSR
jgi:hypothetical protein